MKSVYQILKEYRNRLKNPQYAKILTRTNLQRESIYTEVSNITETQDDVGIWLEFDCSANMKKTHCRILGGYVSEYHEYIKE